MSSSLKPQAGNLHAFLGEKCEKKKQTDSEMAEADSEDQLQVGFRVQGSGFRAQGSGFRVQDSGFWAQVPGFRAQGSEFRIQGSGFIVQG